MEKTHNILLNSSINKKSVNENASLNIALSGNRILLPEDAISDTLNSYDIYLNERKKSNKFRLIINIEPYCSNVLFNPFTEIVKYEGSTSAVCLNFLSDDKRTTDAINHIINKSSEGKYIIAKTGDFVWTPYDAIRDTQLSNEACDFTYHCGIDIFNNHILRNKTLKAVNFNETNSFASVGKLNKAYKDNYVKVKVNDKAVEHVYTDNDFNTIDDYMRDKDGWIISERFPKIVKKTTVYNTTRSAGGEETQYNLKTVALPLHLYQNYDVMTYDECIEDKLLDDNGWYGFSNPSIIGSMGFNEDGIHTITSEFYNFGIDNDEIVCTKDNIISLTAEKITEKTNIEREKLSIGRTINNRQFCDFIDMYPTRSLFKFTPLYNKYRKRLEKNWNYCLTYPSKSITKMEDGRNFPFLRIDSSGNTSLKVYMFDEGTFDDDETQMLTVYTVCQHGLVVGDTVNIYKSDELFYDSVEVVNVIDKYIFQVYKDSGNMSNKWVEVENRDIFKEVTNPISGEEEDQRQKIMGGIYLIGEENYPICESNRCNVDPTAQDIHIRRVVNGVECKYYVRIFSRLPNFKFRDEEVNDFTLYDDYYVSNKKKTRGSNEKELSLIKRFSIPGDTTCEFENHIAKLGFADTAYGDEETEIVFTDDIDISYLRDNLGRPLSDIFLTIIKNNKGYKEWYGIGKGIEINNKDVEYSHCFGKVNGSFLFSNYYRESYINGSKQTTLVDVRDLTSVTGQTKGMCTETDDVIKTVKDEIEFDKDWDYNGDICCYSPVDCDEQIIQCSMHRFNTVQRELENIKGAALEKFNSGVLTYDEIKDDENTMRYEDSNDGDPYIKFKEKETLQHTTQEKRRHLMSQREGYFYQPHYRIPFKTVSKEISSDPSIEHEIVEVIDTNTTTENNRNIFEIKTKYGNDFLKNSKAVIYKRSTNEFYYMTVYEIMSPYRFTCVLADENGNHISSIEGFTDISKIDDFVILEKNQGTPDYAKLIKDKSCRYYWREILSNGIENDNKVYPFTNGAFYVNQQINFFLRRQDPKKENLGLISFGEGSWDYIPDGEDIRNYPNFMLDDKTNYEEEEIKTC